MQRKKGRKILVDDYEDEGEPLFYRAWLIKHGGRPMERALLRAEQRYGRDKRALTLLSRLRAAYGRRTR
jgi:hypothetical protein